jgi:hypothetical protein
MSFRFLTIKAAWVYVGGLSDPEKMPGFGFSIPAENCRTGSKLRKVADSVCSHCYALKGRYGFEPVKAALRRRFRKLQNKRWIEAMAYLIGRKEKSGYFRWHDSGDLQSLEHLEKIVAVCRLTPGVWHWLPTREAGILRQWTDKYGREAFPANLCVRFSGHIVDQPLGELLAKSLGVQASGVVTKGWTCPASSQDGHCGACRACWMRNVPVTTYPLH